MREARVTLLACSLLIAGCALAGRPPAPPSKPRVVTAFYALAFAADAVAGSEAVVTNLTPPGVEPHDVELTSSQVVAISEADVLVYAGRGFQPAVERLAPDVGDGALDVLAAPGLQASLRARAASGHDDEEVDPHVWLDPNAMAAVASAIADRLARIDPADAGAYRSGARALRTELSDLDRRFARGLARCDRREIVTSHEAFGYLAHRYDLEQVGIAGLDPETEPSPQRVADVTEYARARGVTTIFFERLVSPRVAETIAVEAGLRTAMLDPLESPPKDGDYFDAMAENLESLRVALGCT